MNSAMFSLLEQFSSHKGSASVGARVVRSLQSSLQAVSVYERKMAGAAKIVRTKRASDAVRVGQASQGGW